MAAYPFRTPRPGRSWPVRLVVTAMALLVLAAGVLFSAGSDHHRRHAPHAGAPHQVASPHQVTAADLAGIPHPDPDTAGPEAAIPHLHAAGREAGIPHSHTAGPEAGAPHNVRPDHGLGTVETPAHGHQHGNEWTPNLTPRVRLDVHTTPAVAVAARPGPLGPGRHAAGSGVTARHAGLSLLGVLRV